MAVESRLCRSVSSRSSNWQYARAADTASEPYHPAYDPWRGVVSALAWADPSHAVGAIDQLLDTPRPRTRWVGVAACGARRIVQQPGLEAALSDRETHGARSVRRAPWVNWAEVIYE